MYLTIEVTDPDATFEDYTSLGQQIASRLSDEVVGSIEWEVSE